MQRMPFGFAPFSEKAVRTLFAQPTSLRQLPRRHGTRGLQSESHFSVFSKSNEGLCGCMLDAVFIVVCVQESRGTALLFAKVLGIEVRVAKLIWC